MATHYGMYAAAPDGKARQVSTTSEDFMGFTAVPGNREILFASGHPALGGNLGFIASEDGGASWTQVSEGAGGPVDFHALTVSAADPQVLYGYFHGIQISTDGGKTWAKAGPAPEKLIDLAASATDANTLYAGTIPDYR